MSEHGEFITVAEAAAILGVQPHTVRYHLRRGKLQQYVRRGRIFLRRDEVVAFNQFRPVDDGDDERTTGHEVHH